MASKYIILNLHFGTCTLTVLKCDASVTAYI